MEHTKFPSVRHLRHVVTDIPYFPALPQELSFEGTVKLHGTNLGIVEGRAGAPLQVQSRNRMLTQDSDNMGSWAFVHQRLGTFQRLLANIREDESVELECSVVVFGELAGRGVQKGVGIAHADVFFALFAVSIGGVFQDFRRFASLADEANRVYNVTCFGLYELSMDVSSPLECEDRVNKLTEAVGLDCPAAKYLGVKGTGEGIMWRCLDCDSTRLWFKSKSQAHSVRPTKAPVAECADDMLHFVTEQRLLQGLEHLKESGLDDSIGNIGRFTRWVSKNVMMEEGQLLTRNQEKASSRAISRVAGNWFKAHVTSTHT